MSVQSAVPVRAVRSMVAFLKRLSREPPFRLFTQALVIALPVSIRSKAHWDVASRPQDLAGVLAAADEARREGIKEISVFEFGVAGGNVALVQRSLAVVKEREEKSIKIEWQFSIESAS